MTHVPASVPAELRAQVGRLLANRAAFFRLLRIQHKQEQRLVSFEPNPGQLRLLEALDRHQRVIVVKARQVGISTVCRAHQLHTAYTATEPVALGVLSFHERSARHLRQLDRTWLDGLPALLRRDLEQDSATEARFRDTGASLSSWTAGGRGGTRSVALTAAHLSEFAFYPDQEELLAQVLATVGAGQVVIETTPNAPGDTFHRLIEGAPDNGWHVVTYWWHEHHAYRLAELPPDWERTDEDEAVARRWGVDDHQLAWRRQQVATLGEAKFRREYPGDLADAFAARESTYLQAEALDAIDPVWFDGPRRRLQEPDELDSYVVGVDVAAGVGGDYSALAVVSVSTLQPVHIERANDVSPVDWAARVVEVASEYGQALVLCESNNHGHVVLRELELLGYRWTWADRATGRPWTTTAKSKLDAFETLREYIEAGVVARLDVTTLEELRALEVRRVTPEAPVGLHDDLAMALALAYRAVRDVPASMAYSRVHMMERHLDQRRAQRIRAKSTPWEVSR